MSYVGRSARETGCSDPRRCNAARNRVSYISASDYKRGGCMLPHFSLGELVVLLVVVLLILGPHRLPEVAASFGKSIRSFKQGMREAERDDDAPAPPEQSTDRLS